MPSAGYTNEGRQVPVLKELTVWWERRVSATGPLAKYHAGADTRYPGSTLNGQPTQYRQWSGIAFQTLEPRSQIKEQELTKE